jgi:hypothetical protein
MEKEIPNKKIKPTINPSPPPKSKGNISKTKGVKSNKGYPDYDPKDDIDINKTNYKKQAPKKSSKSSDKDNPIETNFSGSNFDIDDQLNISNDVNAFASLLASKKLNPPLSIGLFGDWGSGKSFFMKKIQKRIKHLSNETSIARKENPNEEYSFYESIAHIEFNAWHYMDTNLWASLVTHIFEELFSLITGADKNEDSKDKIELMNELSTTKEMKAETQKSLEILNTQKDHIEERITKLQEEKEQNGIKYSSLKATNIEDMILNDEKIKKSITDLAITMNLEGVADQFEAIKHNYYELKHFLGKTFHLIKEFFNFKADMKSKSFIIGFVLFVILLNNVHNLEQVAELLPFLSNKYLRMTEWIVPLFPFFNWIKAKITSINQIVSDTESVIDKKKELFTAEFQKKTDEEIRLDNEKFILQQNINEEKKRLALADEKIELTNRSLDDIDLNKQLKRFILSRTSTTDYKRHLGIISLIRKDFDRLSEILDKRIKENGRSNHIQDTECLSVERIILYIDDLDRCPPERVVEVLQAIHLILAFPLFVVIVGVDVRWVSRALNKEYPKLLDYNNGTSNDKIHHKINDVEIPTHRGNASTFDYLEKIFQLPFALKSLKPNAIKQYVDYLISDELPVNNIKRGLNDKTNEPLLKPERLRISRNEQKLIHLFAPIIGETPRTIKRFINTYRLVKVNKDFKNIQYYDQKIIIFLLSLSISKTVNSLQIFGLIKEYADKFSPIGSLDLDEILDDEKLKKAIDELSNKLNDKFTEKKLDIKNDIIFQEAKNLFENKWNEDDKVKLIRLMSDISINDLVKYIPLIARYSYKYNI